MPNRLRVLSHLEKAILEELDRTSPLGATELAQILSGTENFSVRDSTVREGLKRLEKDGWIDSHMAHGRRRYAPVIQEVGLKLQVEIAEEVARADSISEGELLERLDLSPEELARALRALRARSWVKTVGRAEKLRWVFSQDTSAAFRRKTLEGKVFGAVRDAGEGGLTTAQLAEITEEPHTKAYGACRRLRREGRIHSETRPGETQSYFFPVTGEVLHGGSYDRIQKIRGDLKKIVDRYDLGDPSMAAQFSSYLGSLTRRQEGKRSATRIQRFSGELKDLVLTAEKKSEISGAFGLKPFFPKTTFWIP